MPAPISHASNRLLFLASYYPFFASCCLFAKAKSHIRKPTSFDMRSVIGSTVLVPDVQGGFAKCDERYSRMNGIYRSCNSLPIHNGTSKSFVPQLNSTQLNSAQPSITIKSAT